MKTYTVTLTDGTNTWTQNVLALDEEAAKQYALRSNINATEALSATRPGAPS